MSDTLIIFDCDGILVDSEIIAVDIDQQVLAEHGWELTRSQVIDRFLGTPMHKIQNDLENFLGEKLPANWLDSVQRRYQEAFEEKLQPVEGITRVLAELPYPRCVASSGSHQKIRHSLGLTDLGGYFQDDHIFSTQDVAHGKPAPDLFLHAAAQMGYAPESCIVVEDSVHGITAAQKAGMTVFGYAGGVTPSHLLEATGAQIFKKMSELPTLISRQLASTI